MGELVFKNSKQAVWTPSRSILRAHCTSHNRGSVLGTGMRPWPAASPHAQPTALVLRARGGLHKGNTAFCLQELSTLGCWGPRLVLFQLGNQRRSEVKGQSQEPGVTPELSPGPGKVSSLSNC